jgi:hypothetical protein
MRPSMLESATCQASDGIYSVEFVCKCLLVADPKGTKKYNASDNSVIRGTIHVSI